MVQPNKASEAVLGTRSRSDSLSAEGNSYGSKEHMENPTDPTPFSIKFFTSNYGTNIKFLGLSPVPGAYQTEEADAPEKFARGLGYDLSNLHWNENPSLIVSTTTDEELESLEIKDFDFSFAHAGLNLVRIPCEEGSAPLCDRRFAFLIDRIVRRINAHNKVIIESRRGMGRATTIAACALIAYHEGDMLAEEAIDRVREMFGPEAVASPEQIALVSSFARYHPEYRRHLAEDKDDRFFSRQHLVLQLESEIRRPAIYRFRTRSGVWNYVAKELTVGPDTANSTEEDLPFDVKEYMTDPVAEFEEAIAMIAGDHRLLVNYLPVFIHEKYKDRLKAYLNKLDEKISSENRKWASLLPGGAKTADEWVSNVIPQQELDGFLEKVTRGSSDPPPSELLDFSDIKFCQAPKDYLIYMGVMEVMQLAASRRDVDYVHGSFLRSAVPGDTVWIVSSDDKARILLVGRLRIREIVDRESAMGILATSELPDAEYFGVARYPADSDRIHVSDIHDLALDIRFEDFGTPSIPFDESGRVIVARLINGIQLSEPSAIALADAWFSQFDNGYDESFWIGHGLGDTDMKQIEHLLQRYELLHAENPRDLEIVFKLALANGRAGRTAKCEELLNEILFVDPDHHEARYTLARHFFYQHRFEEFENEIETMVRHNAPIAAPYHDKAIKELCTGNLDDALSLVEKAISHKPDNPSHWTLKGQILEAKEDFEGARMALRKAMDIFPNNPVTLLHLAIAESMLGNRLAEFRALIRAASIDFEDFAIVARLGAVYAQLDGLPEGAEIEYPQLGDEFDPDDAESLFYQGLAETAMNQLFRAKQRVERLIELGSQNAKLLQRFIVRREAGLTKAPID